MSTTVGEYKAATAEEQAVRAEEKASATEERAGGNGAERKSAPASTRLVSLDVFRGLTVAGMILVNNPGTWSAIYSPLEHAAWHGWTPTDLVFPFFLFIVGVGMDKRQDLTRIAEVIRRAQVDLVGLQEVDRGVERTGRVDEIRELARLTGMEYAFAHNLNYQGGQYGVAVLSRFPILSIDHRRYLNTREAERRGFIRVEVEVKGRRLSFVTTHLDWQHEDGREYEARQLIDALAAIRQPLVVTGDFNEEPEAGAYRLMLKAGFADAWAQSRAGTSEQAGEGMTYPADKPSKRIDYVFYRADGTIRTRAATVLDTQASDHRPLVVDLTL